MVVKPWPLCLLLLVAVGCAQRPASEVDTVRIKVAECFLFSTIKPIPKEGEGLPGRALPTKKPPCLSAGRGVNLSAPVSSSSRRRFFGRIKAWKSKN